MSYLREWSKTAQAIKSCDGNGHLWLVVIIGVVLAISLVQFLGELLVWMSLDAERFAYREDFEEKRQFLTKSFSHILGEECLVVLDEVQKGSLSDEISRGIRGMGAHP